MLYTRRDLGKIALAALPAAAFLEETLSATPLFQAKPNSKFNGVQIGTITYSYRSMPDQSAEATLKYILDSGISAIELMGGPVKTTPARDGVPPRPAAAAAAADAARRLAGAPGARGGRRRRTRRRRAGAPRQPTRPRRQLRGSDRCPWGTWDESRAASADAAAAVADAAGEARAAAGARCGSGGGHPALQAGPGGGGGRGAQTPEQIAAAAEQRKWRTSRCRWTCSRSCARCTTTRA